MKKLLKQLRNIAITVLLCLGVFAATRFYDSRHVETVEVIREVPVQTIVEKEITISGETIRSGMENIGKLCTAEYHFTHVEQVENSREINGFTIPFTSSSFIYSYDGVITAGIDFTEILVEKDDQAKTITVTLPEATVFNTDVDQDSFQLYDEKNNIFNPIRVTDVADSFADLKNEEERKAVEDGLLEKARANARILVENFMRGSYDVGEYQIKVQFEEP
ncbi:MAG: DUF4230 domain-containing protein [Roseburia sp.]|nr:DUF4230 domain-containing protein [Roseburia sp.]MCM1098490.1 DUF4230 domain-containing protein [Ruminococcus flavefaciens]